MRSNSLRHPMTNTETSTYTQTIKIFIPTSATGASTVHYTQEQTAQTMVNLYSLSSGGVLPSHPRAQIEKLK